MRMRQREGSVLPLGVSLAGHLLLLGLLATNLSLLSQRQSRPVRLTIDAAVVPDLDAMRQREAEARKQREAEERQRAETARRQREAREQQRQAAEERRLAAERERLERERRAAVEAEQRQREAEERRRAEAEKRRQAEEARRRQAEEARRRQAEREAALREQLAAEQAREAAIQGGLLDQWIEVIRQKVQRNWIKPPTAGSGLECELRVRQIPGGEVVGVEVGRCNADAAVIRSIENAVYRASPLPPPPDASLFERNIVLIFKPAE